LESLLHRRRLVSGFLITYPDLRGFIARIGVAAFSVSLVLPTIVHGGASGRMIAASSIDGSAAILDERISLPNVREIAQVVAPAPMPAAEAEISPTPASSVNAVLPDGESGVIVTASWYGPGFYDNRLPCWQWLQANGEPIQLAPDTWGVANKTLPCGTMLTLAHGTNVVTVPVVDRGPYVAGRELDLSPRVRAALGCADLCTVLMHVD
jgi:hypothetical protein